uniref:Carboxylic ester hydrolase n=1 Tax=Diaphorina citri TaxID=121845 RepID=A0A0A0WDA2_DIACI|nr:juvenile hormone esterase [Diaphorina citri]
MNCRTSLILTLVGFITYLSVTQGAVVKVKQGLVSGTTLTLRNGKVVNKFIHIPYAQPPVGKRRFKDPEPIKSWAGVWNATNEEGDILKCTQFMHVPGGPNSVGGQEDCLYLSIYTPKLPQSGDQSKLLDVIVYIHGGAFMFGQGFRYKPFPLIEQQDVVYVEFNYRLGPLGFLSTGDDVVPGNMGLKDQTQALRWIQENIAQFGGNPKSVTITGMSAGGASVHYQMLSPQAKGLFHRAISMSGTSLCPWTLAENLPEKTKIIANQLGCPVECNEKMVECLRSRPAALIADAVRLTQPFYYNPFSPWGPTVDSFAKNPILPDFPAELIKQGKIADVPWLNSVTTDEGLYPAAEFLASEEALKTIDADWTSLAPHILDFNFTVPDNLKAKIAEKIRQKYLGDKPINLENKKAFVQIMSDRMFIADAERTSRLQSKVCKSPVYFYYFNFRGRYSLSNHYANRLDDYGVSHADDTQYILTVLGDAVMRDTTEDEQKTMDLLNTLWASFAKTGKPHISSWKPVTPNSFNYLQIDSGENYRLVENAAEIGSRSFWDSLPFDENVWKPEATSHTEL